MKYKPYPAYKDSGVEWLGNVPEGWQFRKTKYLFDIQSREPLEGEEIVTAFRDGVVTLRSNRRVDGFTNSEKEIGYQGVRVNDLVIHAMDAFAGAIGVSDSDGKSTPVYSVCKAHDESVSPQFYGRLLRTMALTGYITSLSKGIRERSTEFRWKEAGNLMLPVPTIEDQNKIHTFLDRETTKLDTLIAKQEKLIELLQEKRQAVISHAVTKGLDPDAPKKDSGVEWLGEVPAHWEVMKVRRLVTEHKQGYYSSESYVDEGARLLRITDLRPDGEIDTTESPCVQDSDSIHQFLLRQYDFVFARTGGAGLFGVVEDELADRTVFASYLIRFRFDESATTNFLRYFFLSNGFQRGIAQNIHGGVNQNVHAEDIKEQVMALPPASEQSDIADFLYSETTKLDALIEKSRRSIELMREHRTALISAAVTGKIDVREAA